MSEKFNSGGKEMDSTLCKSVMPTQGVARADLML